MNLWVESRPLGLGATLFQFEKPTWVGAKCGQITWLCAVYDDPEVRMLVPHYIRGAWDKVLFRYLHIKILTTAHYIIYIYIDKSPFRDHNFLIETRISLIANWRRWTWWRLRIFTNPLPASTPTTVKPTSHTYGLDKPCRVKGYRVERYIRYGERQPAQLVRSICNKTGEIYNREVYYKKLSAILSTRTTLLPGNETFYCRPLAMI